MSEEIKWEKESDMPLMAMSLAKMTINKTGSWRNLRPVLDKEKCNKCGICWKFCPDVSIEIDEEDYPVVILDFCKGCGICAVECPKDAFEMVKET